MPPLACQACLASLLETDEPGDTKLGSCMYLAMILSSMCFHDDDKRDCYL